MPVSAMDNSPVRVNSASSEGDIDSGVVSVGPSENERPERMRDWVIRSVRNSNL